MKRKQKFDKDDYLDKKEREKSKKDNGNKKKVVVIGMIIVLILGFVGMGIVYKDNNNNVQVLEPVKLCEDVYGETPVDTINIIDQGFIICKFWNGQKKWVRYDGTNNVVEVESNNESE